MKINISPCWWKGVRRQLSGLLVFIVLLQPSPGRAQPEDIHLSIDPESVNSIKSWGLTVARIEWDGHYQLPSEEVQRKLFHDLGATSIRIVIGRDSYYDEDTRAVRSEEANHVLGTQLDNLKKYSINSYILSVITAPRFTKRYYTYDSSVEMDKNYLRTECEDDFVSYLKAILIYIKGRGDPLPEAISLVVMPDIGGGLDGGCFYTPEQWKRVMHNARRMLDMSGFGDVGLVGPETYSPAGLVAFLDCCLQTEGRVESNPLSGVALSLGRKPEWASGEYALIGHTLAKYPTGRSGLWMFDEHTGSIGNDREALVTVFQRMGRDLVFYGVDHWCWNFGFMTDESETTLLWGNEGNETPLYRALKELWNLAPPGFKVHRVWSSSPVVTTLDPRGIDAFALVNGTKAVIVIVNANEGEESFTLGGIEMSSSKWSVYTGGTHRTLEVSSKTAVIIPGGSLAIVSADPEF